MGLMRYSTGAALAAVLLAGSAHGQTVPSSAPAQPPAAGALNPAAEEAPARQAAEPQFEMADGIVATVNDRIITGYDLRQRMLMLIASSQVQPTQENLPAIQQAALNALIEDQLKAGELAKFADQLQVSDADVNEEIAGMAQSSGTTAQAYLDYLRQGGIQPGWSSSDMNVSFPPVNTPFAGGFAPSGGYVSNILATTIVTNTGTEGGQEVHHLHVHVMGGPRPWLRG